MNERPWSEKQWSRCALAIAAKAIRRGRLLSAEEKYENLMRALFDCEADRTAIAQATKRE
jgi:hypothetical protein